MGESRTCYYDSENREFHFEKQVALAIYYVIIVGFSILTFVSIVAFLSMWLFCVRWIDPFDDFFEFREME